DHIEVDPRDNREDFKASAGDTVVLGIDPSIRSLRLKNRKVCVLLCIKRDRMDSLCLHMSRSQEEF
nr:hypothetical protein [Tanacetum cinerariifolium]